MIKDSGGSPDKVKMRKYINSINESFTSLACHNYWLGVRIQKNPSELIVLQEILFEKRPDTIIECGTWNGGSAYFMATMMDLMKINGKIITIDKSLYELQPYPKRDVVEIDGKSTLLDCDVYRSHPHAKVEYIHSDCLSAKVPPPADKTMVILDCNHTAPHVYKELVRFSEYVSLNQYIIVEDTNLFEKGKNGPIAAIERFLRKNKNFVIDKSREKYGTSTSIGGYLLRVS